MFRGGGARTLAFNGQCYEKNLSTQRHSSQTHPRLPGAHAHGQRPPSPQEPPGQGTSTTHALTPSPPLRVRSARFTRHNRLVKSSEYQRVFDQALRSASSAFTVLARANTGEEPRLGLVMSTRCARAAVDRNRLKRIVRESFRHNRDRFRGLDIVVIGKHGAARLFNAQLRSILDQHWNKVEQWARS